MNTPAQPIPWSPRTKLVASVLVGLHLLGVFLAPMWFASGQQSPAIAPLMTAYRPYINAMFLNHGYAFFAPEPGPTHLVRYQLQFDNGRADEAGVFPDLATERPRLLYHRHFMLSESLYTYGNLPRLRPNATDGEKAENVAREKQYEMLKSSLARHLAAANHAATSVVHRWEHRPLFPDEVTRDGKRLDAEETYRDLDAPPPAREVLQPGVAP